MAYAHTVFAAHRAFVHRAFAHRAFAAHKVDAVLVVDVAYMVFAVDGNHLDIEGVAHRIENHTVVRG